LDDKDEKIPDNAIVSVALEDFLRGGTFREEKHIYHRPLSAIARSQSALGFDGKVLFQTSKDFLAWCFNELNPFDSALFEAPSEEKDLSWLLGEETVEKIEENENIEWDTIQWFLFSSLLYLNSEFEWPLGKSFKHVRQLNKEKLKADSVKGHLVLFCYYESNNQEPDWAITDLGIQQFPSKINIPYSEIIDIKPGNGCVKIFTFDSRETILPSTYCDSESLASFLQAIISYSILDMKKLKWNFSGKMKEVKETLLAAGCCSILLLVFPPIIPIWLLFCLFALINTLNGEKNKDYKTAKEKFLYKDLKCLAQKS
jgi:hypothetical protein